MNGLKLSTAFQNLKELSNSPIQIDSPSIDRAQLPTIVKSLGADRIQRKPRADAGLILKWRQSLKMDGVSHITDRELRRLSWEPEASLSKEFLSELAGRDIALGRGFLKGLVYSVLTEWNQNGSKELLSLLKLAEKDQRTSSYLKKVSPFLLSDSGHLGAANALISKKSNLQDTLSEIFGIALSSTKYAHIVLEAVINSAYDQVLSPHSEMRQWFYQEILQFVNKEVLLICLEKVVNAIDQSSNEVAKEEFKRFVLFHPNLGDPRLPGYEGNWPKDKAITAKVIEWLSQSDIKFFFELFIEKQSDRQGRKKFWLEFAHLVKGTRVIVSAFDSNRLARQISEMRDRIGTSNLFAELQESNEKSTAFLMDFGNVVVVEFSSYGHSCYFYSAQSGFPYLQRPVFWGTKKFSKAVLKNTRTATEYLSHHDGWEVKFRDELARRYGLRPKTLQVDEL